MIGAREAALLTLNEIFYNGKYSNIAVGETLVKCRGMEKNEKALFTNLVYGVVSRHFTIEYIISKYSSIKTKKLARYVKLILEIGIYQLLYMDKIPESAAVNEMVKLSKKYCKKGSDRFVNAVLRSVLRGGDIEYPEDTVETLSIKHSFSPEMTRLFIEQFGKESSDRIMASLNETPEMLLRPNLLKTDANALATRLCESGIDAVVCDDGLVSVSGFDVVNNIEYKDGLFTPQDRGAYTASLVLAPKQGDTVIDMCAAPGGKTTHIAELMEDRGSIIAFDIHPHKLKLIENASRRLGLNCITVKSGDSTKLSEEYANFCDCVLCDVPCSGWGIIRRKPDIKLSHTDLDNLYEIQSAILDNGARYLKKGGTLVYSTCTINKFENEERINSFLEENDNFEKLFEKTFYPDQDNSDGFYICRLIKK